ncbi:MAG: Lrp/AsnC family transcriptional regulator [Candidatus Bathyarchaeia archaeon]|jgi:Lrp/AsnC family transcriptional regulator for asnA, asnC and gidA
MSNIDEIDAKILKQLLEDGRKSFVEIAKECNTSKDVIAKRYKRMEKAGIIVGATTQLNYRIFGYNAVGNISINVSPQHVDEVIRFVRKIPNTKEVYPAYKKCNVSVIATLRSLSELDQVKEAIRKHASVISLKAQLWLDIKNVPENIFLELPTNEEGKNDVAVKQENNENIKEIVIDEIDRQLIAKLAKTGRLPFSKIAEELETSTDTIIRRYEKLKNNKAIKTVIQLDLKEIGYKAFALFFISLTVQGSTSEKVRELSKIPNVYHIVKTSGDHDLFIITCVKSFEHFFSIRDQIAKIPNMRIVDIEIGEVIPEFPSYSSHISTF